MEERREKILSKLEQNLAETAERLLNALNLVDPKHVYEGNDLLIEIQPERMGITLFNCNKDRGQCHSIAWELFRDFRLPQGLLQLIGDFDDLPTDFVHSIEEEIYEKTIEWVKSIVRQSSLINMGFGIYVAIHDDTVESKV